MNNRTEGGTERLGADQMPMAGYAGTSSSSPPPKYEHLEELLQKVKAIGIGWQLYPSEVIENNPGIAVAYERMLLRLIEDGPEWLDQARKASRVPPTPSTPSDGCGAACWICLEEGPDDSGQGIVRECSCRGDTAGFAHLSCLVQFARSKSLAMCEEADKAGRRFESGQEPFEFCPNCKQNFLGDLAVEMAKRFVEMNEDRPEIDHRRLNSKLLFARRYGTAADTDAMNKSFRILEELASITFKYTPSTSMKWKLAQISFLVITVRRQRDREKISGELRSSFAPAANISILSKTTAPCRCWIQQCHNLGSVAKR